MEIIGTFTAPAIAADKELTDKQRERLGLKREIAMSWKRDDGDHDFYLWGDGGLVLNFKGGPYICLNRKETADLYTFLTLPHVQEMVIRMLRASLLEAGGAAAKIVPMLEALSPDEAGALAKALRGA